MIAVDTNIVLRLLLKDSPEQESVAASLFSQTVAGQKIFIPSGVIIELSWMLVSKGYNRAELTRALTSLLELENIIIGQVSVLWKALKNYEIGKADFVDYFIQAEAEINGAMCLATFDKKLYNEQAFCLHPTEVA